MIGRLCGRILEKHPPQLLLDVGGVGYELEAPMGTFYRLPDVGAEAVLLTHLIIREDAHTLYGFASDDERRLFRSLIKVNGVGPKLALTILSTLEPDSFVNCVLEQNDVALVRVPGIGKKTAQRLIIEMRDRLRDWSSSSLSSINTLAPEQLDNVISVTQIEDDALSALLALGYKEADARRMIKQVVSRKQGEELASSEALIRATLQEYASTY